MQERYEEEPEGTSHSEYAISSTDYENMPNVKAHGVDGVFSSIRPRCSIERQRRLNEESEKTPAGTAGEQVIGWPQSVEQIRRFTTSTTP